MKPQHYNKGLLLASLASLTALAGCQPVATAYAPASPEGYYPMYYPVAPQMDPSQVEPAAGPTAAPMAYAAPMPSAASTQQLSEIDASLSKVDERLQRVEKAMLRLDRRMQLVERNELNRMSDDTPAPKRTSSNQEGEGFSGNEGMTYSAGYQPVSAITSGLQAAPKLTPVSYEANIEPAAGRTASTYGLQSLADQEVAPNLPASSDNELAIWTVSFLGSKVWPERTELPGSRDVVNALKKGQPITVFARGKQPNSVMFRDRVKALSQYLGKVSGQDSIPIAALPGSHLDDNTVEIFATY